MIFPKYPSLKFKRQIGIWERSEGAKKYRGNLDQNWDKIESDLIFRNLSTSQSDLIFRNRGSTMFKDGEMLG